MISEILVQVQEEITSVAVLEDERLVEYFTERSTSSRVVGNIFKGRVENVLPGMQAAFVNIGLERNAFLYVEDAIAAKIGAENPALGGSGGIGLSISEILTEGQEVVVQVTKEPQNTKGAGATTHLTLPGRYLVLMPTVDYIGVSRRIESEAERNRLKKAAQQIKPPGMGIIIRTVAEGETEEELAGEVASLLALWEKVMHRARRAGSPCLLHRDFHLSYRILRDKFTSQVNRLLVNDRDTFEKIREMVEAVAPFLRPKVVLESRDLFGLYGVTEQLQQALKRRVWLKCGGYVVIDQTEALTAIDVNTGKFVGSINLADTVLRANLEAAVEIARQLRLRNIGGIIIIDFIDMEPAAHQEMVLTCLEEELKKDRTKTIVLGLTRLGLVEMTRKKTRQGLSAELQMDCPYCNGTGKVLSGETVSLQVRKELFDLAGRMADPVIVVEANPAVTGILIGPGGSGLRRLEEHLGKHLVIRGVESMHVQEFTVRNFSDSAELAGLAVPVSVGQVLTVQVEGPHTLNASNGIARIQGFVLDIAGAAGLVGQEVGVEITKVFRTSAKAKLVPPDGRPVYPDISSPI